MIHKNLIINTFITLGLCLCIVGCNSHKDDIQSYTFDNINLDMDQEAALDSLEIFKDSFENMSKDQQFAFQLKYNLAKGKCLMPLPSIAKIQTYIKHFENNNDTKRLIESYLLMSYAYTDKQDYKQLFKAFKTALKLPQADKYPRQLARLYSIMGHIYYQLNMDSMAYNTFYKATELYERTNDSILLPASYRDLGNVEKQLCNSPDSVTKYYHKAFVYLQKTNNKQQMAELLPNYIELCLEQQDMQTATELVKTLQGLRSNQLQQRYIALGNYYIGISNWNNLQHYADSLGMLNSPLAKQYKQYYLFLLSRRKQQYQQSNDFLIRYVAIKDSIDASRYAAELLDIEQHYKNDLLVSKNKLLKAQNQIAIIAYSSAFVLCTLLMLLFFRKYRRHVQTELKKAKDRYIQLSDINTQKNQELDELKVYLKEFKTQHGVKSKHDIKVAEYRQKLVERMNIDNVSSANESFRLSEIMDEEVYKKIKLIAQGKVKDQMRNEDWQTLMKLINNHLDDLLILIKEAGHELNDKELRLCCLELLSIPNREMAIILNCTPSSISNTAKRMYKKLLQEEGNAKKFHEFMYTLR